MCKSVGDFLEFRNLFLNELLVRANRMELSREEIALAQDLAVKVIDCLIVELVAQFEH
jgi:hypothetical protein